METESRLESVGDTILAWDGDTWKVELVRPWERPRPLVLEPKNVKPRFDWPDMAPPATTIPRPEH